MALVPRQKDYELQSFKTKLRGTDARAEHPLQKQRGIDKPAPTVEPDDVSTQISSESDLENSDALKAYYEKERGDYESSSWEQRKREIMEKFRRE